MLLYPKHIFGYYFFCHFRALPCSLSAAAESFPAAPREPEQLERSGEGGGSPSWVWITREGRAAGPGGIPASAGLPRGSPGPTTRGANIPNAKAALLPTAFPKRAASERFPGNRRKGVWETLSGLHLGLFELGFEAPFRALSLLDSQQNLKPKQWEI